MKIKNPLLALGFAVVGLSQANAAVILTESFVYADGPLVASGSPWATTSGTAGQVNVTTEFINITGTESEDVNVALAAVAYTVGKLTATFELTFTTLPTGTTYFSHFLNSSSVFRSKLFSTVTGAGTGAYRLGITNNGNSGNVNVETDLMIGETYTVELAYDLDTATTTMSIDGGTAVTASDTSVTSIGLVGFGFRQSSGIGTMTVDNLSVAHVVPEPTSALLGALGFLAILRRRR